MGCLFRRVKPDVYTERTGALEYDLISERVVLVTQAGAGGSWVVG